MFRILLIIVIIIIILLLNYKIKKESPKYILYNIILKSNDSNSIEGFHNRAKEEFIFAVKIKLLTATPNESFIFLYDSSNNLLNNPSDKNIPPQELSSTEIGQRGSKPININISTLTNQINSIILVFLFDKSLNKGAKDIEIHQDYIQKIGGAVDPPHAKHINASTKIKVIPNIGSSYNIKKDFSPLVGHVKPTDKKNIHALLLKITLGRPPLDYSNIIIEIAGKDHSIVKR
jgi:hypothetical protein